MLALIQAGAPLEVGNKDKNTALHCAALNGHLKIVEYLIAAEAVLEVRHWLYGCAKNACCNIFGCSYLTKATPTVL